MDDKKQTRYRMVYDDYATGVIIDPRDMHEMLESDPELKAYFEARDRENLVGRDVPEWAMRH